MIKPYYSTILLAGLSAFASVSHADFESVRADFLNPPQDAKLETWWHFTTNAITKEGITADLEALKEVGYGGAHVFSLVNQTATGMPKIQILDDNWRELMRHAGREAKRLGLRLGAHNCPGWSSSGGPWIKPEDSMKMLVASETRAVGGEQTLKLPQPRTVEGFYRDVAVLAVRGGKKMPAPKVSADFDNPQNVVGENTKTVRLPLSKKGAKNTLVFEFKNPYNANFAELTFDSRGLYVSVDISVSDDGRNYSKVGEYSASIYNDKCTPKFVPLSKNGARAKFFKFEFATAKSFHEWEKPKDIDLKNVRLLSERMIADVDLKNSLAQRIGFAEPKAGDENRRGLSKDSVLDITANFQNGEGKVNLPDGNWIVLRIGYTSTGAKNSPTPFKGLECDKLSRRGLDAHWPHFMKKLEADFGGSMRYATIDSYEVGGQNWTDDFAEQFEKRRGYDIKPWLPAMLGFVVETDGQTAKFLYDLQRTVSDLFAENYYDYFAELCKKDGLLSIAEPYGGLFDSLRCARNIDIPTGEFWIGRGNPPARMTGSSAHLFGKKKAGSESFTTTAACGRWLHTPAQLKEYGDRAWIYGISSIIFHTYAHQPFMIEGPGMSMYAGSNMTRLTTWWKLADAWVSYVNRSQALLQRGRYRATVLWLSGESQPNGAWYAVRDEITNAGYDYDYCSADDIADSLKFEDGEIFASADGTRYKMLALGADRRLSLRTLKAVEKLLEAGTNVAGVPPIESPTLSDNPEEFAETVKRLWGGGEKVRKIGKGTLYAMRSVPDALSLARIAPEFKTPRGIRTIGRIDGDTDIRFVANMTHTRISGDVSFNAGEGKSPYIFDAVDGGVSPAPQWKCENGIVSIPLSLNPYESKFVVFKNGENRRIAAFAPSVNGAKKTDAVEILEAVYRSSDSPEKLDVKDFVKGDSDVKVQSRTFKCALAPGHVKELYVKYKFGRKVFEKVVREGGTFVPPVPEATRSPIYPAVSDGKLGAVFEAAGTAELFLSDGGEVSLSVQSLPKNVDISENWDVAFQKNRGAPATAHFEKLESWTENSDDGIRYFSGIATYSKKFELGGEMFKKGRRIILSLGNVADVARVRINGKTAATLWRAPFECDITELAKKGDNTLSIEVANRWPNRLIGDARLAKSPDEHLPKWIVEKRKNDTDRIAYTFTKGFWNANEEPLESGLLGKVEIRAADFVEAAPMEK